MQLWCERGSPLLCIIAFPYQTVCSSVGKRPAASRGTQPHPCLGRVTGSEEEALHMCPLILKTTLRCKRLFLTGNTCTLTHRDVQEKGRARTCPPLQNPVPSCCAWRLASLSGVSSWRTRQTRTLFTPKGRPRTSAPPLSHSATHCVHPSVLLQRQVPHSLLQLQSSQSYGRTSLFQKSPTEGHVCSEG